MRFMLKPKMNYYNGYKRIIKRFALFPIKIDREIRWLETCYISQVYNKLDGYCDKYDVSFWGDQGFVSKDEYIQYIESAKR